MRIQLKKKFMKTTLNDGNVHDFLNAVENKTRKKDAFKVLELMQAETGQEPKMWGDSIVGFGQYHYKYDSGREGDFLIVGFSPRKTFLSVYIMPGFDKYKDLMENLGKYKTGKACLNIKKLEDVDEQVLGKLIRESYQYMENKYNK